MKLRNKKTGEIVENAYIGDSNDFYNNNKRTIAVFVRNGDHPLERVSIGYETLAELNEEWEDYEEPKDFWFIDPEILIACESTNPLLCDKKVAIETMKMIGNYFETREEAEKAVEKLKAWKRLKDKGFEFEGWDNTERSTIHNFSLFTSIEDLENINKDLDLLFGGEE